MKKLQVFLSSAMTGELDKERELIRYQFKNDHILKEFYDLFAIEDNSSPRKIEDAFVSEVERSDIVLLIFREQLRNAVLKEYEAARKNNKLVFIYLSTSDKKNTDLSEFISSEIYLFDPGVFSNPSELCNKIKEDLLNDLLKIYSKEIHLTSEKDDVVYSKKSTLSPNSVYRFFKYDELLSIGKVLGTDELSIDQIISLASLLIEKNANYKIALALFELALIKEPNNWILHNNRGLILDTIGLTDAALFSYSKVIELDETNDTAYYNLGQVHFRLANYDIAIKYYKKALDLHPDKKNATSQISACYLMLKNKGESLNWAKKAYALCQDQSTIVNLISAFVLNNNFEDANKTLSYLDKCSVTYKNSQSFILYKETKYNDALELINELINEGFLNIEIAERKYNILIHMNLEEDAFNWFREIEKTFPLTAYNYNNMGHKYVDVLGKSKYANYFFRKAVELDKNLLPAWQNLQYNLAKLGEYDLCIEACDQALNISPFDKKSIGNKITALAEQGKFTELIEFNLEKMISVIGNNQNEDKIKNIVEESFKSAGLDKNLLNNLFTKYYELSKIINKDGV